jgi:hypothetical protein
VSDQLTVWDYEKAMFSQNACNASGLIHSLAEVTEKIWVEARALGKGTEYVNNHPILRLYIEQLQHLCRTSYSDAHAHVAGKVALA